MLTTSTMATADWHMQHKYNENNLAELSDTESHDNLSETLDKLQPNPDFFVIFLPQTLFKLVITQGCVLILMLYFPCSSWW